MNMLGFTRSGVCAIALLSGSTAMAADWTLSPAAPSTMPLQNGVPTKVDVPVQDGLHSDHRWAAMEHCINGTSQADFNRCLATAFLQDGTGSSGPLHAR